MFRCSFLYRCCIFPLHLYINIYICTNYTSLPKKGEKELLFIGIKMWHSVALRGAVCWPPAILLNSHEMRAQSPQHRTGYSPDPCWGCSPVRKVYKKSADWPLYHHRRLAPNELTYQVVRRPKPSKSKSLIFSSSFKWGHLTTDPICTPMIVCRCGILRACVGSGRARARRRALKVRHDHVAPTVSSAFIILIHTGGLALLFAEFFKMFLSLPDSGRAAVNMAELANQLGRIV